MTTEQELPLGLYWKGKRTTVDRTVLPFQHLEVIETVNESRATREREKTGTGMAFNFEPSAVELSDWRNKLIWGDNKYVMAALLEQFAGKIDLIYIDPPFATGANFSTTVTIGDNEVEHTKEASAMEELVYRDTWGKGLDSFLQMMYDRLVLMRELLSEKGSLFVHCDWRVSAHIRLILDEIFGNNTFKNEIIWHYRRWPAKSPMFQRSHDTIFWFGKTDKTVWNQQFQELSEATLKRFGGKKVRGETTKEVLEEESAGAPMRDVWEVNHVLGANPENVSYPTQKPEALLERIIKACSNDGDLVADFFAGSGTTAATAEKLNRRWITADLGRFAVHTTRKRMLEVDNCKPFEILNIGKYERQFWQGVTFGNKTPEQSLGEYIAFILKLYKAEALPGSSLIHGRKGNRLVHVGSVEAPVTFDDIQNALQETIRMKQKELVVLGWEWEMGLHNVVELEAKKAGVKLSLLNIPREVMDRRAVDAGDVQFFELAYLEAELKEQKDGHVIKLTDFAIENMDMIPADVKKMIKKWSDYIDYWSVDWDYNNDTFQNMWQSYRTKRDRTLLLKTDPHRYTKKGKYRAMVKVIDIFGNDTTQIIEIRV
jgi:DNA modification methylase